MLPNNCWNKTVIPNKQKEIGFSSPRQSPPEELNDDVLPTEPMSNSPTYSKAPQNQNPIGGPKINPQIQGRSLRSGLQLIPKQNYIPSAANSPQPNFSSYSHQPSSSMTNDSTGVDIDIERQFGFNRPTPEQLRAQVQEVLRCFHTYPLNDCHDKVKWLATVVLQQLLDLELYGAASLAFEQVANGHLKRLIQFERRTKMLTVEKKKHEQREKHWTEERIKLEKQNAEFAKQKANLEMTMKSLKQFETKFHDAKKEGESLKSEIFQMTQELEEERKKCEESITKCKGMEQERDEYRRRLKELIKQETEAKRKVNELQEKLEVAEKSKKANEKIAEGGGVDETTKKEMKRMMRLNEQLQAQLKERGETIKKMEEQLEESKAQADKHRHAEMECRERLRRRTERAKAKIEEQHKQLEEAETEMNGLKEQRAKLEEELQRLRAKEAKLEKRNKRSAEDESVPDEKQLDSRAAFAREVARKKQQLDKAIATIAGAKEKSCGNCPRLKKEHSEMKANIAILTKQIVEKEAEMSELRKRTPKVTIRMVDPNAQNCQLQNQQQNEELQQIDEPDQPAEITLVDMQEGLAQGDERRKQNGVATTSIEKATPIQKISEDVLVPKVGAESRKRNLEMEQDATSKRTRSDTIEVGTASKGTPSSASPLALDDAAISPAPSMKNQPTLSEPIAEQQLQELCHPDNTQSVPPTTRFLISDSQRSNTHQPNQVHQHKDRTVPRIECNNDNVLTVQQSQADGHRQQRRNFVAAQQLPIIRASSQVPLLSSVPSSSSPSSPSHSVTSSADINDKITASKIVTSFMLFVSKHPDRNTQSLISDYLKQSGIPLQFQPLIREQLSLIASASENVRMQI